MVRHFIGLAAADALGGGWRPGDGEVVGYVRSEHHDDVSRLLAIGVPLSISLTEEGAMRIIVNDPTERTAWLGEAEE